MRSAVKVLAVDDETPRHSTSLARLLQSFGTTVEGGWECASAATTPLVKGLGRATYGRDLPRTCGLAGPTGVELGRVLRRSRHRPKLVFVSEYGKEPAVGPRRVQAGSDYLDGKPVSRPTARGGELTREEADHRRRQRQPRARAPPAARRGTRVRRGGETWRNGATRLIARRSIPVTSSAWRTSSGRRRGRPKLSAFRTNPHRHPAGGGGGGSRHGFRSGVPPPVPREPSQCGRASVPSGAGPRSWTSGGQTIPVARREPNVGLFFGAGPGCFVLEGWKPAWRGPYSEPLSNSRSPPAPSSRARDVFGRAPFLCSAPWFADLVHGLGGLRASRHPPTVGARLEIPDDFKTRRHDLAAPCLGHVRQDQGRSSARAIFADCRRFDLRGTFLADLLVPRASTA